jgi:alanine racemase
MDVTVDLGAYRRNLRSVAARIAPAELMAVVKADAYGHGLLPVARAAVEEGVRWIGALDPASALTLRRSGATDAVHLFTWLFAADEDFAPLVEEGVDLGISSTRQLDRIAVAGVSRPARVHLKIDTGLHRNGASEEDWPGLVTRAVELGRAGVIKLVGVWTHIAEASDEEDTAAIRRFRSAVEVARSLGAGPLVRHLAASAAGLARVDARFDLIRVGAFGYGIAPGDGVTPADLGIEPVMTAATQVASVREDGSRRTAVLPVGYLDGVPSSAAGRVAVAIDGRLLPVVAVGAQSMDVDVSGTRPEEIAAGTRCTLFGTGAEGEWTLQQWADALGTIGEEIVVRFAPRTARRYVDG